ncbi:MAG: 50S ribosomal protein L3 [Nanoarchaeota archaeon]
MGHKGHIRHGSLQFWPRKRAEKILPSANLKSLNKTETGLLGFIGYKVGMISVYVKDISSTSLTKGQKITIPATVVEFPTIKILSVRFYKNRKVVYEILNYNIDKEIKRKIKIPKNNSSISKDLIIKKIEEFNKDNYDDLKIIAYSQVKKTVIKKNPDIIEIILGGSKEDKINFVKENLTKEINVREFSKNENIKKGLIDIRGVSTGRGFQGSTKRFGLKLRFHKSEKGVRGAGSGGPWHPARVDFTQPKAGQLGYFSRTINGGKILMIENIKEKDINPKSGFNRYGIIKNDYALIHGSIMGPPKRQLLFTAPVRISKNQSKKNYEFIETR